MYIAIEYNGRNFMFCDTEIRLVTNTDSIAFALLQRSKREVAEIGF
jgi:hypothetical protein